MSELTRTVSFAPNPHLATGDAITGKFTFAVTGDLGSVSVEIIMNGSLGSSYARNLAAHWSYPIYGGSNSPIRDCGVGPVGADCYICSMPSSWNDQILAEFIATGDEGVFKKLEGDYQIYASERRMPTLAEEQVISRDEGVTAIEMIVARMRERSSRKIAEAIYDDGFRKEE